jgi:hypothetical protein
MFLPALKLALNLGLAAGAQHAVAAVGRRPNHA